MALMSFGLWCKKTRSIFAMADAADPKITVKLLWRGSDAETEWTELDLSELDRPRTGQYRSQWVNRQEQVEELCCNYTDPTDAGTQGGVIVTIERTAARMLDTAAQQAERAEGRARAAQDELDRAREQISTLKKELYEALESRDEGFFDAETQGLILEFFRELLVQDELRSAVSNFVEALEKDGPARERVLKKMPEAFALLASAMGENGEDAGEGAPH